MRHNLGGRLDKLEQIHDPAEAPERGLIRLTGLWKSTSRAGDTYLAGSLSPSSRLLILPNSQKKKDSDPDYIAFLTAPAEKKAEGQAEQRQGSLL